MGGIPKLIWIFEDLGSEVMYLVIGGWALTNDLKCEHPSHCINIPGTNTYISREPLQYIICNMLSNKIYGLSRPSVYSES